MYNSLQVIWIFLKEKCESFYYWNPDRGTSRQMTKSAVLLQYMYKLIRLEQIFNNVLITKQNLGLVENFNRNCTLDFDFPWSSMELQDVNLTYDIASAVADPGEILTWVIINTYPKPNKKAQTIN